MNVLQGLSGRKALYWGGGLFLLTAGLYLYAQTTTLLIRTVAGTGNQGYSTGSGVAENAQIELAYSVAADVSGNIYVADSWNHRIRKIAPNGSISDFAGIGTSGFSGDNGLAISARLNFPRGLAVDIAGNVFVSDSGNGVIRKIQANGVIVTVAGNGVIGFQGDGGPALQASFRVPRGLAVDAAGNLYIGDSFNARIRKVGPDGKISTIAGTGQFPKSGDGGLATNAAIGFVHALAFDASGNLYFTDAYNHCVRRIAPNGVIGTIAGTGQAGFSGDGGFANFAALTLPRGLSLDAGGNLILSDSGNNRIRQITPQGVISTIAGSGSAGFSGDGGPGISAQLQSPVSVVADNFGNIFVADSLNYRIRKITSPASLTPVSAVPFAISNFGGASFSTSGSGPLLAGYGRVKPGVGGTTPSGVAIFGYRQQGILVSEMGVPISPLVTSGRTYAEVSVTGSVNTGVAFVNPNNSTVRVSFDLRDKAGNIFRSGFKDLLPNEHFSSFLDAVPYLSGPAFQGIFSFTSTSPVSVIALRGFYNERTPAEFLMSTLPVLDLSLAVSTGTQVIPHFAAGGGYTTQIVLVNPTGTPQTGTLEFRSAGSATTPAILQVVNIDGVSASGASYFLGANGATKFVITGASPNLVSGSVRVIPSSGGPAPTPLVIFSYKPAGITVSEAAVPVTMGTAFRVYVELSPAAQINAGIAIANATGTQGTVTLSVTRLNGSLVATSPPLVLPPSGQIVGFLDTLIASLGGQSVQGVLRITTDLSSISVVGLRARYNERSPQDFLIATTPPTVENALPSSSEKFFPQIANGNGFTTQVILFSGTSGQSGSGNVTLFQSTGAPMILGIQ